ncbi:hypothetical protein [Cysteiniphilum halobium]|uniref:hypothetical protein n=1 Tax=Cysteiniphilum halobium TaxID=2219059 RepID=UPI000E651692|nr:hypothetical protein [Cysteiniphilum halobium]
MKKICATLLLLTGSIFSFSPSFASIKATTAPDHTSTPDAHTKKQATIVSDTAQTGSRMKVISPGNQSMSLEDQLRGVQAPQAIMPENPVAVSQTAQINYPVTVGNEGQIDALQTELSNMFAKADKNADDLTKYQQYSLYLAYKQAQQNQLILEQNNKIILALEKISLQNQLLLAHQSSK